MIENLRIPQILLRFSNIIKEIQFPEREDRIIVGWQFIQQDEFIRKQNENSLEKVETQVRLLTERCAHYITQKNLI